MVKRTRRKGVKENYVSLTPFLLVLLTHHFKEQLLQIETPAMNAGVYYSKIHHTNYFRHHHRAFAVVW